MLLNSKEEWVDGSYKPSNLAESITTFLEPGTYYVDIWSPQGAKDTNYKLSLQLTSGNAANLRSINNTDVQEKDHLLAEENRREEVTFLPL